MGGCYSFTLNVCRRYSFFVKDDQNQRTFLCWLLIWLKAMSSLKINLKKSELIPIGRVEDMEMLATELGCKVGRLPSPY